MTHTVGGLFVCTILVVVGAEAQVALGCGVSIWVALSALAPITDSDRRSADVGRHYRGGR